MFLIQITNDSTGKVGYYGVDEYGLPICTTLKGARHHQAFDEAEALLEQLRTFANKPHEVKMGVPGWACPHRVLHSLAGVTVHHPMKTLRFDIVELAIFKTGFTETITVEMKKL